MAATHGSRARVYGGGWDLSAYLNTAAINGQVDTVDVSAFTDTYKRYVAGLKDASFTANGFFDGGSGGTTGIDYVLFNALGRDQTPTIWTYYPAGDTTAGDDAYGIKTINTAYDITSDVGDAVRVSTSGQNQSSGGMEALASHLPLTASISSGGTGGTVDGSAASTGGGAGYLQITALNGGTVTMEIQDSADGSTGWAQILNFSTATAAHAAERVSITGTVRRYTRAVWAVTAGTATISTAFGRH